MKILTNTSSTFYGGIARHVAEMTADAQRRQNVDVVVLGIGRKKCTTDDNIIKYNIALPDHIQKMFTQTFAHTMSCATALSLWFMLLKMRSGKNGQMLHL